MLGDGHGQIRVDLAQGTVLQGAVRLHYPLTGLVGLEPKLLALERLSALVRLQHFPRRIAPPSRPPRRAVTALRAFDARQAGARHRDIAAALFGAERTYADWSGGSDYLHTRVKRLIRLGAALSRTEHRRFPQHA